MLKEHFALCRQAKIDDKRTKTLFALEIEFRRPKDKSTPADTEKQNMTRDQIMSKYINHPYMEKFLSGKIKRNLAEIVRLIDTGEADDLIEEENQLQQQKSNNKSDSKAPSEKNKQ